MTLTPEEKTQLLYLLIKELGGHSPSGEYTVRISPVLPQVGTDRPFVREIKVNEHISYVRVRYDNFYEIISERVNSLVK